MASMDKVINILITVALVELMVAIGLSVPLIDVVRVARDRRLVLQAVLANYLCVPAAAVGLLLLYRAEPMIAAGFLIAAACPGAPYGPPFTAMAKGNVSVSVGLMVILAGSSALVTPVLLNVLTPFVSGSDTPRVDVIQMVFTLLWVQLLPLGLGLALRQWRPNLAARLERPANFVATLLNVSVIALVLVVHFQTLAAIRPSGFVGMLALVLAALAAGWLLGMPGSGNRTSMAITTSVRNVGVGLVIATSSYPGTAAVTATLAFALFQTIAVALLAVARGRLAPTVSQYP